MGKAGSCAVKCQKIAAAIVCSILAACTTPAPSSSGRQLSTYDVSTEYATEYSPDGFTLLVHHRYPDFTIRHTTAVSACRTVTTAVANSLADRWGRKVAPIEESRVAVQTSRNWLGKITACSATVPVTWAH